MKGLQGCEGTLVRSLSTTVEGRSESFATRQLNVGGDQRSFDRLWGLRLFTFQSKCSLAGVYGSSLYDRSGFGLTERAQCCPAD